MELFWKSAVALCGLGGIGAFVFWSLYKDWIQLPIFSTIPPKHTFVLMLVFLVLTFLSLISILITYVVMRSKHDADAYSDQVNLDGEIKLVDVLIDDEAEKPTVDIKVRNPSNNVVLVKSASVEVLKRWDISASGRPSALPISGTYDILLSGAEKEQRTVPISQQIKPKEADRFALSIGSTHAPYPYLGLFLYLIEIRLVYNEDNRELVLPPILLHLQTAMGIRGYFDPGPSDKLIATNKAVAKQVFQNLPKEAVIQPGIISAIQSWVDAPKSR
jgi:hypothetical protein